MELALDWIVIEVSPHGGGVIFKLRSKCQERYSHGKSMGKDILYRGKSKCESPEAGKSFACLRNKRETVWLGHGEQRVECWKGLQEPDMQCPRKSWGSVCISTK